MCNCVCVCVCDYLCVYVCVYECVGVCVCLRVLIYAGGVNLMLEWDSPNEERGNSRFAALQSDVGRALLQRGGKETDERNR